ncbi:hypothetical protein GQ53DRAFT_121108 [Thozetella sp. PMI_491]|nr:hypothetical protein GQ53DRAFT_121108 [Thozetella sp. PMI_491]
MTTQQAYHGPPNTASRRFSSIVLVVLLYTAATPFQPFSWLMQIDGSFLFDRLLAGILLLCACYFQWSIASLKASVIVNLPSTDATVIRDGRVERGGSTPLFIWRTSDYWSAAAVEALLLVIAEWGPSELLRRAIVAVVVASLWVLGLAATPAAYKRWAWEHIKAYIFVLVLDELRNVAFGGGGRARRTRRRF